MVINFNFRPGTQYPQGGYSLTDSLRQLTELLSIICIRIVFFNVSVSRQRVSAPALPAFGCCMSLLGEDGKTTLIEGYHTTQAGAFEQAQQRAGDYLTRFAATLLQLTSHSVAQVR